MNEIAEPAGHALPSRPVASISALDSTAEWRADPYRFIRKHCEAVAADAVSARLLAREAICMRGAEASELFYDETCFERRRAAPELLRARLFRKDGVPELDGSEHRARPRLLERLCTAEHARELAAIFAVELASELQSWQGREVALYGALHAPLTRAVCRWAGVPLEPGEIAQRTADLVALFDAAHRSLRGNVAARLAQWRSQRWLARLIHRTRRGQIEVSERDALRIVASHSEESHSPLPAGVAAAELLSLLQSAVASSVFIVHAMHALHHHCEWRARLEAAQWQGEPLDSFAHEARRMYPLFPAVVARVQHGDQGEAGSGQRAHRDAGDAIAIELVKSALRVLHTATQLELPEQNWSIDYQRSPALPRDRVRLRACTA